MWFIRSFGRISLTCLSVSNCERSSHFLAHKTKEADERQGYSASFFLAELIMCLTLTQVTRGIHTDCLLNYETVKYFGGEAHENERYASAIRDYQSLEYRVICEFKFCHIETVAARPKCTVKCPSIFSISYKIFSW